MSYSGTAITSSGASTLNGEAAPSWKKLPATVNEPSKKPRKLLPASPMNSRAGAWLWTRNPARAPTTISSTAGANRLPTAACAAPKISAAIRPTLAARPSMLSSMLNELVSPTIQSTVTAPPSRGWVNGPNRVIRAPEGRHRRRAAELDRQPRLPVKILAIVDEPHHHHDRAQADDPTQLAGALTKPPGCLAIDSGSQSAPRRTTKPAGRKHDHDRQPDRDAAPQRGRRRCPLCPPGRSSNPTSAPSGGAPRRSRA